MISAPFVLIGGGAIALAVMLVLLERQLPADVDALVAAANDLLPQLQCAQCGYPGCLPYAQAVVRGDSPINRCPPGGDETVEKIAVLLGLDASPIDPELAPVSRHRVAIIDESRCIGCALCIPVCPVDAIVGAAQFMHTVVTDECTGCELCLAPCPVDCITMTARAALRGTA